MRLGSGRELACFEQGKAHRRMPLGTLVPSYNCQETGINTAPLNSANEMSALPNTGLMASLERCSLSERAGNSITAGLGISRGCCFPGKELAQLTSTNALSLPPAPPARAGAGDGLVSPNQVSGVRACAGRASSRNLQPVSMECIHSDK